MKNLKIIPLLAIIPFVAGCNTNASKDVKFAQLGKEVEFEDFAEELQDPDFLGVWGNISNNRLPSAVITIDGYSSEVGKEVSKKKTVAKNKSVSEGKAVFKYDSENLRTSLVSNSKYSSEIVDHGTTNTMTSESKYDYALQISKVEVEGEEKECFVGVNKLDKMYNVYAEVGNMDYNGMRDFVENDIEGIYNDYDVFPNIFVQILDNYLNYPVELKEKYTFYKGNKTYTIHYTDEYYSDSVDGSDGSLYYLTKYVVDEKYQIQITGQDSYKYVSSIKEENSTEYLKTYVDGDYTKYLGDKYEETLVYNTVVDVKTQKVTLKEVNLSKYRMDPFAI